jgi:hypothetical protein
VAWTLCALGNSVDAVAGFVGHRNSQVMNDVYIAMSQAQRREMVNCPWLRGASAAMGSGGSSVREQGIAMAEAICSPFGSEDGRTFPDLRLLPEPGPEPPTRSGRLIELLQRVLQADQHLASDLRERSTEIA